MKSGAFLHRAVVHDNVYVGPQSNLRGCVIGKNTDIMRAARIEDGAVIGDECLIGEESIVQGNVRVYPFKTIEAGAFVNTSVIWESPGPGASLRRPRRLRHPQRRDHPGAGRAAGRRLRDDPQEGLDRHHRAATTPVAPARSSGR